jgi:hypothetical protein
METIEVDRVVIGRADGRLEVLLQDPAKPKAPPPIAPPPTTGTPGPVSPPAAVDGGTASPRVSPARVAPLGSRAAER